MKITPPIGELKIALMPAAVPQPMSTGTWARAMANARPKPEEMAAPIWTIGPSAPADPPVPMVTALVRIFSSAATGRSQPLERVTVSMTSTTPCPPAVLRRG